MNYTVKNKKHDQDNIKFFDVTNAKEQLPDFLDYDEVLAHSLKNGNITDESNIKSICDGGDHLEPYFSENDAAFECEMYVECTSFEVQNQETGEWESKTLEFDSDIDFYELF